MLYIIAHFQKYFPAEAPRTPRCREVWEKIKLENRGVGKEIKLVGTLYTPENFNAPNQETKKLLVSNKPF